MKHFFTIILTIVFITIFSSGCKDTLNQSEIDSVIIPDKNVSYSQHIQPVMLLKCAFSGCHDDQSRAAALSLTSYLSTTQDLNMVFPGEPQNSRLMWSLEGFGGTSQMPPLGFLPLNKNQIDGVRIWIQEGAKNN